MYLRCHKRIKDGKEHRYWSVVESVRTQRGVHQRHLLYLGELNDSQRAQWCSALDVLDESNDSVQQMCLFPNDRTPPPDVTNPVQIRLSQMILRHPRQWGGCWLAMELWNQLGLDSFWQPRLPESRKGTQWLSVLKTLVRYRLLDPGSEWRLHRDWFKNTAMTDLLGEDDSIAAFECDVPENEGLRRFGYSRDKRSDCVQVVIALIVTPKGFPVAYVVMPGNTSDKTTLPEFLRKIEAQYGNLIDIDLPGPREAVTPETFRFRLNLSEQRKTG